MNTPDFSNFHCILFRSELRPQARRFGLQIIGLDDFEVSGKFLRAHGRVTFVNGDGRERILKTPDAEMPLFSAVWRAPKQQCAA